MRITIPFVSQNNRSKTDGKLPREKLRRQFAYWVVSAIVLALFLAVITDFFGSQNNWTLVPTLIITTIGSLIAYFSFQQKQEADEVTLFHQLFVYFNQRYDELNQELNSIHQKCQNESDILSSEESSVLDDYFNLCGEEYFYYQKGVIYPEVWSAWCAGMKYFLKNPVFKKKWEEEQDEQGKSYYGLTTAKIQEALENSKTSYQKAS